MAEWDGALARGTEWEESEEREHWLSGRDSLSGGKGEKLSSQWERVDRMEEMFANVKVCEELKGGHVVGINGKEVLAGEVGKRTRS